MTKLTLVAAIALALPLVTAGLTAHSQQPPGGNCSGCVTGPGSGNGVTDPGGCSNCVTGPGSGNGVTDPSAAGVVSQAEATADQSVPKEAQSKPVPKTEEQSCWHPGLSRNIGIAEPSCDLFASEPRIPPQSTRPCSGNKDQRRASC